MDSTLTGYPSTDKPWLKYYSSEVINAPLPENTMYEYLVERAEGYHNHTAISYFGRKISYGALLKNIHDAAASFAAIGVRAGDIVAVALPNIPENIYCIYALNMLGAVADMIDLRTKGDTLLHYLSESGARTAVICDMFAENTLSIIDRTKIENLIMVSPFTSLPFFFRLFKHTGTYRNAAKHVLNWKTFLSIGIKESIHVHKDADTVACIAHTSGTTSTPKGVMLTSRNINSLISQYISIGFDHDTSDRMLNQVPPFLAYWFLSFHLPFALHMTVILLPEYRPDKFAESLLKYAPNHVFAGPGDWGNLLTYGSRHINYSSLKSLASGSDHLDEKTKHAITEVLREGGCKNSILEGYGMTECCSAASSQLPGHIVDSSVGVPLPKNTFCIYDNEANAELTYNTAGEICICGPSVMKGYFNNAAETANVLRTHSDGKLWLHTGDLGSIDRDGNIYLSGRLKRVIVRYNGMKVSPSNIERVILTHPAVSACCTVGKKDTVHSRGQVPAAFVVLEYHDDNTISELKALCRAELSESYLPAAYHIIDALPLTPNGKVDYRALERISAEEDRKAYI